MPFVILTTLPARSPRASGPRPRPWAWACRPPHRRPPRRGMMPSLALSPLAPVLGQRVPLRGPARLLLRSYRRTPRQPGAIVTRLTTQTGDIFEADMASAIEWQLWAFGGFEKHFAELFTHLVGPGDRCIDV